MPTDRIPVDRQIVGLEAVGRLYQERLERYRRRLRELRRQCEADRCFIIGNGPSLKNTDLSLLQNEVTFATNGFFLMFPEISWRPSFYVVEDHLVAEDRGEQINALRGFPKLFPANLRYILEEDDDTIFFDHRPRISYPDGFDFSFDADRNTFAGGTVTYTCMQLAAFMGFKKIYLIGVDANYDIPEDAKVTGRERVKEIDMASDDPNHFHPDYFGKGKRWHEPNVHTMLAAYAEAKRACEARKIEIVNATKGGRLEVFPRQSFDALFESSTPDPRLLVFDLTAIGDHSATGELKASLFKDWPQKKLMQVFGASREQLGLMKNGSVRTYAPNSEAFSKAINRFDPDVILYRPTPDSPELHKAAMDTIRRLDKPVMTWIMDDWPTTLGLQSSANDRQLLSDWTGLIESSVARLSISEQMSAAFEKRYGVEFHPIANGIEPDHWPKAVQRTEPGLLRVRYAGSLAENMSLQAVLSVAKAIEELAANGFEICLEIKTRQIWKNIAEPHFKDLQKTRFLTDDMSAEDYRSWLSGADIVVIGYNFDSESKNYVRYSLANKLPECLACGAPLLAIGPPDVATLAQLKQLDCAELVTENSQPAILAAIKRLADSPSYRFDRANRAQSIAASKFHLAHQSEKLRNIIQSAAQTRIASSPLVEPRSAHASVDEIAVIARLLAYKRGRKNVMIDVGAHTGASAEFFDRLRWTIHCFEPDSANRVELKRRFGKNRNITIDPRAVSDKPARDVAFFTSRESNGISALHAFRDSHTKSDLVDVTTIEDVVKQHDLSKIDFLKIDVEGFDLHVLRGVSWQRTQPEVIVCEFEDSKTKKLGHSWQDIADYLQAQGYSIYLSEWHPIVRYGVEHDWKRVFPYPGEHVAEDSWGNILAFRDDPGYKQIVKNFRSFLKYKSPLQHDITDQSRNNQKGNISRFAMRIASNENMLRQDPTFDRTLGANKPTRTDQMINPELRPRRPNRPEWRRFLGIVAQHFGRRWKWILAASLPLIAITAMSLHPTLAPIQTMMFGTIGYAVLLIALIYVAYRSQSHAQALYSRNEALLQFNDQLSDQLESIQIELEDSQEDFGQRVSHLKEKYADLINSNVGHLVQRLSTSDTRLAQATDNLAKLESELASLDSDRARNQSEFEAYRTQIDEINASIREQVKTVRTMLASELQSARDRAAEIAGDLDEATTRFIAKAQTNSDQIDVIKERLGDLDSSISSAHANANSAVSDLKKLQPQIQRLEDGITPISTRIDHNERWMKFDNANWYQSFNRNLAAEHIDTINRDWRKKLALQVDKSSLGYIADRACVLEQSLSGRFQGTVEDILLQTLIARALNGTSLKILEIGTLFGVRTAIMFDHLRDYVNQLHFTIVDPLEGLKKGTLDPLTGIPITERVIQRNFQTVGMRKTNFSLVKHSSTAPEAIENASSSEFDMLIIDGDHSFAGVKSDFENYVHSVKLGGYIVFDKYSWEKAPDVQRFVDEEADKLDFISKVGSNWHTCVYRTVKN